MKRAILLSLLLALMTGCENYNEVRANEIFSEPVAPSFVQLTFREKEFEGEFSKDELGNISLTLNSENLPLKLSFSENSDAAFVSCEDLEVVSSSKLSPSYFLFDSFKKLADGEIKKEGKNLIAVSSPYEAVLDEKELKIKEISFPMGKLSFLSNKENPA